tara:strand:- start:636 stop:2480 length:1845 start_codon:yes stop_codon:yes gene_type:complete
MKLTCILSTVLLVFLITLTDKVSAKSGKITNWKSFSSFDQTSRKSKMIVGWDGRSLVVKLKPQSGEGGYSLAKRVLVPEYRSLKTIRKYSKSRNLYKHRYITFPLKVINGDIRSSALKASFYNDKATNKYWQHIVTYKWETTSMIAGLFTKKGIKAANLVRFNKMRKNGDILQIGDNIKIPWNWISPELRLRTFQVKSPLKLKKNKLGKWFAQYQMQAGDTLYSSVVVRFTGRLLNDEVNLIANQLLKLNNISEAKLIQNHQNIKIPLELLSEEYIGSDKNKNLLKKKPTSLKNVEKVQTKKPNSLKKVSKNHKDKKINKKPNKISRKSNYSDKKNVFKLHVILDSGHGGGDPGAIAGSKKNNDLIYEDEVVYDISRRVTQLMRHHGIIVHNTLTDPNQKKPIRVLSHKHDKDEQLLVTPRYLNRNSRTGANMRVYLVNHIFNKLKKKKVPKENIMFISLHGDALHSSLRGAMVYYPDRRFRRGAFGLKHKIYRKRKEYNPSLIFKPSDNIYSEKLSKSFGKTIINEFRKLKLPTHKVSSAVRGYLYRKGKKTLPAVLRYSKVPTSVLIEIANLNNKQDRRSLLKSKSRQKIALAITNSVVNNFGRTSGFVAKL